MKQLTIKEIDHHVTTKFDQLRGKLGVEITLSNRLSLSMWLATKLLDATIKELSLEFNIPLDTTDKLIKKVTNNVGGLYHTAQYFIEELAYNYRWTGR